MIFGKKQKNTDAPATEEKAMVASQQPRVPAPVVDGGVPLENVLLSPRITEKATDAMGQNIFTFDVDPRANKQHIRQAIQKIYKIEPLQVNIVTRKQKKVSGRRGKGGMKAGGKKAYVYLKDGDSIELI